MSDVKPYEAVPRRASNMVGYCMSWRPRCLDIGRRLFERPMALQSRSMCDSMQDTRYGGANGSKISGDDDRSSWSSFGVHVFSPWHIQPNGSMSTRINKFVDWTHKGGRHGRQPSRLSAPLRSIHSRRSASLPRPLHDQQSIPIETK